MKLSRNTLALGLLAAIAAPAAHAEIAIDVIGGSEVSFEGLFQADGYRFNPDFADLNGAVGANGKNSEFGIRRAEVIFKGKGPNNIEWTLGYDASTFKSTAIRNTPTGTATTTVTSTGKWLDANIKYKFGNNANHFVQIGQFKQPNSLEELSSTRFNDFIAKASVTNTFGVARRTGIAYRYGDVNWGITASYFGRELTRNLNHGAGFGARGNWAPINESGNILHLGLSYMNYDTDGDSVQIRARPLADLATVRLVDTGTLRNTDRQTTIGAEAMWVKQQFKVQAEYMRSNVDRYATRPVNPLLSKEFTGDSWYVSGLWNITGETWGYKDGVPTTILPDDPSRGMWQLGLRYDRIDLNDGTLRPGARPTSAPVVDGVLGGEMDSWTLGANLYWRSNFKFMVNYVMVNSSRYNSTLRRVVGDNPNVIEARAQLYW